MCVICGFVEIDSGITCQVPLFTCSYIWRLAVSESSPTATQIGPEFINQNEGIQLGGYSSQDFIHGKDHVTLSDT